MSQGELAVAGVYVRVFNQQPNFPLADPAAFCKVTLVLHLACKPGFETRVCTRLTAAGQCHYNLQQQL